MKNETNRMSFVAGIVFLAILFAPMLSSINAWADEENVLDTVAGCQAVAVNPEASLEFQQAVCGAAEGVAASSCAASGNGMCSSPKMNDTMPMGTNCICLSETTEEAPADEIPAQ